jgi:hypothetical protein
MRVEPHGVGSIVHVIKRGARGVAIVRTAQDRERFVRALFYLNDTYADANWPRETAELKLPNRPLSWPEREPLVRILAWTLLSNHFHLLLQEVKVGGVAKFMQRLCGSMSMYFNAKYKERGSLFQGGYRGVVVDRDAHLTFLVFYILVKNVFDMYPGGVATALKDFDRAWEWAKQYPYSSLSDHLKDVSSPITDDPEGLVKDFFADNATYKQEARELLELHLSKKGEDFATHMLEPW